jgi:hypothetical protein
MTRTAREPAAGPSFSGTVVLELGPGAGALILNTQPELDGAEIDISCEAGELRRTHSMVRPRHVAGGTSYAAVYPSLPPGEYTIWRDDGSAVMSVQITSGAVTIAHLETDIGERPAQAK